MQGYDRQYRRDGRRDGSYSDYDRYQRHSQNRSGSSDRRPSQSYTREEYQRDQEYAWCLVAVATCLTSRTDTGGAKGANSIAKTERSVSTKRQTSKHLQKL